MVGVTRMKLEKDEAGRPTRMLPFSSSGVSFMSCKMEGQRDELRIFLLEEPP